MNHAGIAPLPRRVAATIRAFADEAEILDETTYRSWELGAETVRARIAHLIGADTSEIAFVRNTSEGLSLIAGGLPWEVGDNVVALEDEYPANVYPWWGLRRRGVETRMVARPDGRFGADTIAPLIDRRTRVVAVSAVDWQTGFRADLAALGTLCRERNVLLCVDGIQAVGALCIDVAAAGVDFLATGGHKWLLAPEGCGALFVSRRVVERVEPILLGWKNVKDAGRYLPYHFELRDDAARLEEGTPPNLGIRALGAAVDLLIEAGPLAVEARILAFTAELAEGLRRRGATIVSPQGDRERSGILTFRLGDPAVLHAALTRAGIVVRQRAGGIRLAPHFYNSGEDAERIFAAVDASRGA